MGKLKYYVIRVDYFVYDETKEDGIDRTPMYLFTSRDKFKVFTFNEERSSEDFDLKWFLTREEAQEYIDTRPSFQNSMCFDNVRIEEIDNPL